MKSINLKSSLVAFVFGAVLVSCESRNNKTEAESNEEDKVGNVYDADHQGPGHETRDNQFPESRNDNQEGTGLETGAPTDTASANVEKVKQ
ncbi:MAG: hypothetical protein EOO45_02995 [Flavobacterium sp.]|nr:MAG: hypothetical protein EOO45_02995 [Flavobacterium sp.]